MAYESLYRRYRPRRFSEVRGQADVVRALSNAVREDRVGHAYLLSGPRGTGKTSTARILAKALNCTDLIDGEPCCACDSCLAIESGTSYDLQELDAASNNGVDAMRDLIGKAALGSPGRTKVYILDEVHMLSTGASNALLKTLEEPPGHVVFVLATTDPHKVLPTIRSRTQHFEMHLLPAEELSELVRWVISDAELDVDEDAIAYALAAGGGSARDTLSALDQVVAAGGVLDRGDQVDDLVDALATADTGAALTAMAGSVQRGHDPRVVGEALLARMRDVFLYRMGDPLDHLPEAVRSQIITWSEQFSDRACTQSLEAVGDALRDMRQAPDARIPLEVALVRLTRPRSDTSLDALVHRIEQLERGVNASAGSASLQPVETRDRRPPKSDTITGPDSDSGTSTSTSTTKAAASTTPSTTPSTRPSTTSTAAPTDSNPDSSSSELGHGGGRLDAARALLAEKSSQRTDNTRPAPSTSPAADRPRARDTQPPPPLPGSGSTPPATNAPNRQSTPPPDPGRPDNSRPVAAGSDGPPAGDAQPENSTRSEKSSPAQSTSNLPSREELTVAWADAILPTLGGLTKAMYSVGRFTDSSGSKAVFAVPNAVHREKSEQKRPEVEAALERHFGRPVPLDLVIDKGEPSPLDGHDLGHDADHGGGSSPPPVHDLSDSQTHDRLTHDRQTQNRRSRSSQPIDDPYDEEIGNIADLADAPADDRTTVERVIEAFPGAEVVDP